MNKEYDNNNTGALFLADKLTSKGDKYYNGSIIIENKEHKITMFINNSENPKAPKFRLKVNVQEMDKPNEVTPNDFSDIKYKTTNGIDDSAFADFGNAIELEDDSVAF